MLANVARFDYDWLVPPTIARSIYEYFDPAFLLSIGPFAMDPGQSLPSPWRVWLACASMVQVQRQSPPDNPYGWYERVSFTNLARNALWRSGSMTIRVVDTDGDGYAGEFLLCGSEQDSIL